jgi:hypothetical protein
MAGHIGWPTGSDPVTCNYLIDGASVLGSQCGVDPSYTLDVAAGQHTFQMEVCDRFGACVRTELLTRDVAAPAQPPQSISGVAETTGGVANTWTNYTNAGGTPGPQISANTTVEIACRVEGFRVADGNTWWYRIAQAPWSNQFYVSADVFYNVPGMTSGSLHGTPFVDEAVPLC